MKLSIILVNYNTSSLTLQCLNSIYKYVDGFDFEIILVDNFSSDNSVEIISSTFPDVNIIANTANWGFGRANNQALKIARGEYCFLLNTDTIIIDNSIQLLINFLDTHPEVSIVGGQLINSDGKRIHSYGKHFPSFLWELELLMYPLTNKFLWKQKINLHKKGYYDVAYITGADMMIRHDDLNKIGYFDEDFFMYFEETDLSFRFFQQGLRSVFYPKAQIIHLEGASFIFKEKRERLYYSSRALYYAKHKKKNYICLVNYTHLLVLYIWTMITKIFKMDTHDIYTQKLRLFKEYK